MEFNFTRMPVPALPNNKYYASYDIDNSHLLAKMSDSIPCPFIVVYVRDAPRQINIFSLFFFYSFLYPASAL